MICVVMRERVRITGAWWRLELRCDFYSDALVGEKRSCYVPGWDLLIGCNDCTDSLIDSNALETWQRRNSVGCLLHSTLLCSALPPDRPSIVLGMR